MTYTTNELIWGITFILFLGMIIGAGCAFAGVVLGNRDTKKDIKKQKRDSL